MNAAPPSWRTVTKVMLRLPREGFEKVEVFFPRHAEDVLHALIFETLHEKVCRRACLVVVAIAVPSDSPAIAAMCRVSLTPASGKRCAPIVAIVHTIVRTHPCNAGRSGGGAQIERPVPT